jgi:hypothetical protein
VDYSIVVCALSRFAIAPEIHANEPTTLASCDWEINSVELRNIELGFQSEILVAIESFEIKPGFERINAHWQILVPNRGSVFREVNLGMMFDEVAELPQFVPKKSLVDMVLDRKIQILGETAIGEISFAESVSAFEDQVPCEGRVRIQVIQQPAIHVVFLNIRRIDAELPRLRFDFQVVNHALAIHAPRAFSAAPSGRRRYMIAPATTPPPFEASMLRRTDPGLHD